MPRGRNTLPQKRALSCSAREFALRPELPAQILATRPFERARDESNRTRSGCTRTTPRPPPAGGSASAGRSARQAKRAAPARTAAHEASTRDRSQWPAALRTQAPDRRTQRAEVRRATDAPADNHRVTATAACPTPSRGARRQPAWPHRASEMQARPLCVRNGAHHRRDSVQPRHTSNARVAMDTTVARRMPKVRSVCSNESAPLRTRYQ